MFHYWTRESVNDHLRLGKSQSYNIVPATQSGRIRSDCVLALINHSRVGIEEPLQCVPSDLLTPEETVTQLGAIGVTRRDLRRWTRSKRNVVPHLRINRSTIRYSRSMLEEWLARTSVA